MVSIVTVCRNEVAIIERCIESVQSLDYPNLEHVVQDGASTDGTCELLRACQARFGPRLRIVSEPDTGSTDGLFRALRRCRGELIGSCMADESLLPQAARWAAMGFRTHPGAGAIYGDHEIMDLEGRVQGTNRPGPFRLEDYLLHRWTPPFAASFFRRDALEAIGLTNRAWDLGVGEFELWIRLALRVSICYLPGIVARYAVHPGAASVRPEGVRAWAMGKAKWLEVFFHDPDVPAHLKSMRDRVLADLRLWEAECYVKGEAMDWAREAIEKALAMTALDRERAKHLLIRMCNLAAQRLHRGSREHVVEDFRRAVQAGAFPLEQYFELAQAFVRLGLAAEATEIAQDVLVRVPGHGPALALLAAMSAPPVPRAGAEDPASTGRE